MARLVAGAAVGDAGVAGAGGGWRVDADMSRARGVRRATGDARGVARVPSSKFNASRFGKTQRFN